jgi:glutamate/tyrosine decarboxylase-like PLP-dependent enzyme
MSTNKILNQKNCDPKEIALKSFFLGPQAENASWVLEILEEVFDRWVKWRKSLFSEDGCAISSSDQNNFEFKKRKENFKKTMFELVTRFESEVPKFSPRYIGHMFSEISLPALFGHIVTLLHNPNNISGESSRIGIKIELEAIQFLLSMLGFSVQEGTGHFTSGGTIANFEALTRAYARYGLWLSTMIFNKIDFLKAAHLGWQDFDEIQKNLKNNGISMQELSSWNVSLCNSFEYSKKFKNKTGFDYNTPVILVPENMHYSWKKGAQIFGFGRETLYPISLDYHGRLSTAHLTKMIDKFLLEKRPILMVVSVLGSTELGSIDPIDKVQDILDSYKNKYGYHIWHHVDGAYGGFFRSIDLEHTQVLTRDSVLALKAVPRVTSITIDPHKLGYVPYASGAFLVNTYRDYYFKSYEDAPYIDFDEVIDRGPYTIEGSRSAAGAVATWMSAKTMGFDSLGYGLLLERTLKIRKELELKCLDEKLPVQIALGCDTNILCFTCAKEGESLSVSNKRTLNLYENFSPKKNGDFIVSKTKLSFEAHQDYIENWVKKWNGKIDSDGVVCVRICLMNPFFSTIETNVNYMKLFIEKLKNILEKF